MKVAMNHISPVNVGLARAPLSNLNEEHARELVRDVTEFVAL